jgi:transposase
MNKTLFIGIDVSKLKLDVALTADGNNILSYAIFENNEDGFKKLTKWIKKQSKKYEKIHYCMEATGIYSEDVSEYLQEKENSIVSIVNPAQIKAFANSLLLRTKTDKVDAKMIANYAAKYNPAPSPKMPEYLKKFKILVRHSIYLTRKRASEKTKLESVKDIDIKDMILDTIDHYTEQIEKTEKLIENHIKENAELQQDIKLIISIPSLGDITARIIIAETHYLSKEALDTKAEIANAGLSPQERTSGKSIKGKAKISKKGKSILRSSLYMPAMSTINRKSIFGEFYQRLIDNKKAKMVALTAVMRKLLAVAIGVLKSQKPFDPNWAKIKQEEYAMTK